MSKKLTILFSAIIILGIGSVIFLDWNYKKSSDIAYECYYSAGNNYVRCGETTTPNGGVGGCYGFNELQGNRPEEGIKIQTKGIKSNLCDNFDRSNMQHVYYDSYGRFIK